MVVNHDLCLRLSQYWDWKDLRSFLRSVIPDYALYVVGVFMCVAMLVLSPQVSLPTACSDSLTAAQYQWHEQLLIVALCWLEVLLWSLTFHRPVNVVCTFYVVRT